MTGTDVWTFLKPYLYQMAVAGLGVVFGVGGTMGYQKLASPPAVKFAIPAADRPAAVVEVTNCDFKPELIIIQGQGAQLLEEWQAWRKDVAKSKAAANFRPAPKKETNVLGILGIQ